MFVQLVCLEAHAASIAGPLTSVFGQALPDLRRRTTPRSQSHPRLHPACCCLWARPAGYESPYLSETNSDLFVDEVVNLSNLSNSRKYI